MLGSANCYAKPRNYEITRTRGTDLVTPMTLYYATTNTGKFGSLKRILDKDEVEVIQVPLDIPEPRSSDVQTIAREKAFAAYAHIRKPVVVTDAVFLVFSLRGFPKAYVNFALETIGVEGILTLVAGKRRECEFQECLAYLDGTLTEPVYFLGRFRGTLATEQRGEMKGHLWSELSRIFIPEGENETLAEMGYQEYVTWAQLASEKDGPERKFSKWFVLRNDK